MDKLLKPERFNCTPESASAGKEFNHWFSTFSTFIKEAKVTEEKKLGVLVNFLSYNTYELISDCRNYTDAIKILQDIFQPKKNILYARHLLSNRKQHIGESIDQYLQALNVLSKDCNFEDVDAKTYSENSIRDSFISGIASSNIRQRILENNNINLQKVVEISRIFESAQKHSEAYDNHNNSQTLCNSTDITKNSSNILCNSTDFTSQSLVNTTPTRTMEPLNTVAAISHHQKCYFCGGLRHTSRFQCPALNATCKNCFKKGHFQKVCKSKTFTNRREASAYCAITSAIEPSVLSKAIVSGMLNGIRAKFLIDTGSSDSFVDKEFVIRNKLNTFPEKRQVSMASSSLTSPIKDYILANLDLQNNSYHNQKLLVIENLCTDILIGHDLMKLHSIVNVDFGGPRPAFSVCNVACASVEPPPLFHNLTTACRPIATKSRRFFGDDEKFIRNEVQSLLREGIIEESTSPWRAQVVITKNERHKKRLVIDYSQTINKFTLLDAYPLPEIETLVSKVAEFDVFSTIDLKSAYHQIPIKDDEKHFTAFEADGKLYQFTRIPFGVTNGVAAFQRTMNKIISDEKLEGVFAYLDDITIGGNGKENHDRNLTNFLNAVKKYNLTLNLSKCQFAKDTISLLGYQVSNKTMRPDPERLKPLLDLSLPNDPSSLKRILGMFSHYSKWVPKFSEKIRTLVDCKHFPIPTSSQAAKDFQKIKEDIANSVLVAVEKEDLLTVETDASGVAIAATLSQNNRPVAFFSRTLSECEKQHSTVEREAKAIVESLKKWKHFLLGKHFQLITDQKALSFIFDFRHSSKIKNDKIMRWRLEMSPYSFDIQYRPGRDNVTADTLSRVCSTSSTEDNLIYLHQTLCHPGITRMYHWVRSKNLPYSIDDIKKMTLSCPICAEVKPRFHKQENKLIKATAPFERLSIDFKGPLPSRNQNRYLLNIVDEYSRFPFSYPCKDLSSGTVIKCFLNLFTIFGTPAYIHSDRGKSFLSKEVTSFLHERGIATSLTTPYNPAGNGQIERFNGIIWKTILLALKTQNRDQSEWEDVLNLALHSIRSLLCTATNCTPHERFFIHPRRSTYGTSLPAWLLKRGPVFVKRNVRASKYEPLVEEAELLEANPQYALIRHADGRETTVSLKQLAPRGDTSTNFQLMHPRLQEQTNEENSDQQENSIKPQVLPPANNNSYMYEESKDQPPLVHCDARPHARPKRDRKSPAYLKDYTFSGGECHDI